MTDTKHIYLHYIPTVFIVGRTEAGKTSAAKAYQEKFPNVVILNDLLSLVATQHLIDNLAQKGTKGLHLAIEIEDYRKIEIFKT